MFKNLLFFVCLLALATPLVVAAAVDVAVPENPTYSRDVAPILNQKCVSCHRADQGAPMTLQSYEEVRPWVRAIARNVGDGTMPPWHATAAAGALANDRSLDDWQKETVLRWVSQGAARGDEADLPEPPTFSSGEWKLGEPDFIVTLPEVVVPAGGRDIFENLSGKLMLPEDRWLRAVEILPGNPKVVHHVITIQVKGFNVDPQQGWLGAWAAGTEPMVFPEGTARKITKGSNLIGDMHYHPAETEERDITRIGLYFIDESEVRKELANLWIMNTGFEIPPGAGDHEVAARYHVLQDGKIYGFGPHMHYRGKDMSYTATYPDGRQELLFAVDDYDFNWQTFYTFEQPLSVPEGTVIDVVAHFDNSADNPDNPDPTIAINFGDESYDEMMIGFVDFVVDDGVSLETVDETKLRYLKRMVDQYAEGVYVYGDENPSGLYVPRSGEGTLYLRVNDNLVPCRIYEIEWNGTSFTAQVDVPNFKILTFAGTADDASLSAKLQTGEDRAIDFEAQSASGWEQGITETTSGL